MTRTARLASNAVLISLLVCVPFTPAGANESKPEPVAKTVGSATSIEWQSPADNERLVLTVSGPDGRVYTKEFAGGRPVTFRTSDFHKSATDGVYVYELRVSPRISADVKRRLAAARAADDEEQIAAIQQEAGIGRAVVQSGAFTYRNGAFLPLDATEADANDGSRISEPASTTATSSSSSSTSSPSATTAAARFGRPVANDQVIPDDLIVQGSTCTGFDCVDNESFGFDTLRLKDTGDVDPRRT